MTFPNTLFIDNQTVIEADWLNAVNDSLKDGSGSLEYDPPFTDSVATNVEAKLAQTVSVKDFGAVGDGVTDDTAAIVLSGGKPDSTSADFLSITSVNVINAVRDGVHFEAVADYCWIEDFTLTNVRITQPGRHGFAMIIPDYSATFINQGTFNNCEVRGAGLTTTGYDVYCDCLSTLPYGLAGKTSEITFINCEFDADHGTHHGQASVQLNLTGTAGGQYDGWQFLGCTFEDVGGLIITGFPNVIQINNNVFVSQPICLGGIITNYGFFVDVTKVTGGVLVKQTSNNRNLYMMDSSEYLQWGTGNAKFGYGSNNVIKAFGGISPFGGYINKKTVLDSSVTPTITLTKAFSKIYLRANVTSVVMPTVTSEDDGLKIIIQFQQNSTGGNTVSGWPSDVLFSNSSFIPTTNPYAASSVELIYDYGENKWYETSRSLNM